MGDTLRGSDAWQGSAPSTTRDNRQGLWALPPSAAIAPEAWAAAFDADVIPAGPPSAEQWLEVARRFTLRPAGQELRILKAIFAEWPDKAIMAALGISKGTQREYINRLFEKLQPKTRTRAGLIVRVMTMLAD